MWENIIIIVIIIIIIIIIAVVVIIIIIIIVVHASVCRQLVHCHYVPFIFDNYTHNTGPNLRYNVKYQCCFQSTDLEALQLTANKNTDLWEIMSVAIPWPYDDPMVLRSYGRD